MTKGNRFGFNLGDYDAKQIKENDSFKAIVPEKMRNAKRWLLWRSEKDTNGKKPRKVPYYADGIHRRGTLDNLEDLSKLVNYEDALKAMSQNKFTGLGFALGQDGEGYWQGIDLDNILEHENSKLADSLPSYVEASPSGNGVHAIGYGEYFRGKNKSGESGWEYYSRAKYFTFTGNAFRNREIVDLKPFIKKHIDKDLSDDEVERKASLGQLILSDEQVTDIERALKFINPDCPRDTWLQIGFSLARVPDGFRLFYEWSKKSLGAIHGAATDVEIEDQWNDIYTNSRGEISLGTLYHYATKNPEYQSTEVSERIKKLVSNKLKDRSDPDSPLLIPVTQWTDKMISPDWVIDNFIGEGVRIISGAAGKGKTSIVAPLCANVAHLIEPNFMTPRHRRIVFYFTEDTNQLNRMIVGMKTHQSRKFDDMHQTWSEHFKIHLTKRYKAGDIEDLANHIKEFNSLQDGKSVPALVVFDTQAASFDIEDENNNAELSKLLSQLKIHFWESHRIPVWVITHITKDSMSSGDYEKLTARGAGAIIGDAHGTLGITEQEGIEGRILGNVKDRDGAKIKEVRVVINHHNVQGLTPYGEIDTIDYYTTEFFESDKARNADLKVENKNQEKIYKIFDAIRKLNKTNEPTTESKIRQLANMQLHEVKNLILDLIDEGKLEKIQIEKTEALSKGWMYNQVELYQLKGNWDFI